MGREEVRLEKIGGEGLNRRPRRKAAAAAKAKAQAEGAATSRGPKETRAGPAARRSEEPDRRAQKNFTDPES